MGRVQHEIRQQRAFQGPAHEAVVALLRTADLVRRQLAVVVEPHGITLQQYNVLRILRGAGPDGVPTLEVASRMIEQTPGITRLLDRLEAKGLVRRQRCPRDRRQHLCWITTGGATLLEALDAPMLDAGETSMRALRHRDRMGFIRLLDAIRSEHEPTTEQS